MVANPHAKVIDVLLREAGHRVISNHVCRGRGMCEAAELNILVVQFVKVRLCRARKRVADFSQFEQSVDACRRSRFRRIQTRYTSCESFDGAAKRHISGFVQA